MEVLSPSKRHAAVLEMVSDEEEEEGAQESEQEEGEICSEDEEGEAPCPVFSDYSANATNSLPAYTPHFSSFPDHRPNKTPSLATVASEVVIYDDKGRTAIFTSPKKPRISSYPRRGEVSRQHARELLPRRKEKEGERSRRHHSSSSLQTSSEKWPKASWRSAMESKGAGPPQEGHARPYRAKTKDASGVRGGHRARKSRPPSPDSSSRSSSCSSCSSSSSSSSLISCSPSEEEHDVSTVSPCKGRGKENRRCGLAGKSHDRPHSQEYGCDPPPPAKDSSKPLPQPPSHRPKHGGSQHGSSHHRPPTAYSKGPRRRPSTHHNSRRSPKESVVGKTAHQRTHQKPPKARPSERKDSSKLDKPVKEAESVSTIVKGQNRLPRGSLGEMLLSRPKAASTHPIPGLQDIPRPPGEDPKTPASPTKPEKQQQEEKVVQEVIPDSHTSSEGAENLTLDQEDDEELQLRLIAIQSSLRLLTDMQREGQTQEEAGKGEESCHTSSPIKKTGMKDEPQQEILNDLLVLKESRTPLVKDAGGQGSHASPSRVGRAVEADAVVIQISDDIISISSSSASEICSENLATNTSYLEEGGGGKGAEDSRRRGKERSDVDQDPVDMEICNSSGEEEAGQAMVVQDSPLSPEPGQDTGKAALGEGPTGVSGSNFQMPVEWAYMMPPPPPPDQPANDLHNINSWCFDQNMYLQAMQVAPQEEQQQGQAEAEQGTEWVAPAQPHASPWPGPFMEAYDNNTLPQDTSSPLGLPMGLPPDQHQQQQDQQQHPPEYAFSEPALPQHASPPGHGSDLKDAPAEHYQAFMSAVLQQQQPSPKGRAPAAPAFTECPQRNLIMVPLSGSHQPTAAAKASKKVKAKIKKVRTKKRLRKKQVLQECSNSGSQQQMTSCSTGAAGAVTAVEEEDEELLRAKLLIDMSRKKEQRLQGATTTTTTPPTASTSTALSASFPAPANKTATTAREAQEGRASPQTLLQPSEALVPSRSLRVVKGHDGRPRSGESSPTHSFRGESRKGLSDIGGWGLDPKGSKFNYHSSAQHDFSLSASTSSSLDVPKVKFPTIQPIIISLQSDTDDSGEEGEGGRQGPSTEPMSHSIDILLKSMRNANTASTSKEVDPASSKPGPSTEPSTSTAPSSPAIRPKEVADSTPQAVRHLSRHQQMEYRWLKEQLKKKEMLQRRKMLQRPLRAKPQPKPPPPPPPLTPTSPDIAQSSSQSSVGSPAHANPSSRLSSGSEGSPSTRAVTWKDMGLLQIQVHNDAALDLSSEGTDLGDRVREAQDDSSASASAVEDDDEETLRMMALRTQKSKKTETQCRRVVVDGRASENEGDTETKDVEEEVPMETSSEENLDEGLRGEWMVLDEVREEGMEAGEEELCARPPGSSADELKCGEGTETSDDEEAVIRYPSSAPWKENQSTKQQVPRTTDKERTKEQTNKMNGNEAQICEGEAAQYTASATTSSPSTVMPDQPASEGGSVSQSDTDTKQQDPPVKPGVRQVSEPSCDKIIEEVIRRIENKTRGVRGEASRESSPAETNRSSVPSQGSTKKQVASHLPSKKETKTKLTPATQKLINLTSVTSSHSVEKESTLVKSSHSTSTTTTTTSVSLAGMVSRGAAGGPNQSRAAISNQNGGGGGGPGPGPQRTVLPSGTMQKVRRVQVVRPQSNSDSAGNDSASAPPTTTVTTAIAAARAQDADNPTKAQLKRVEKEYKEKKSGINKMIVQLGQLLKEVNEERQQQQEFKKSISELQAKLREMETQYERKSSALQTKVKRIGDIQVQYGSERQVLRRLEHHGETLGKQVYGPGFSFKSLPVSPRSKVKDVSTKKTLASSIYALQQQVRDLTNKQKNSLKTSPNKTTEAGVVRKQNTGSNGLKTPPPNITEAGVLRRQNTADNLKTPPASTTERGVLRRQNTADSLKTPPASTTEAGVLRRQNTADNLKTPPASTTERGVVTKQNTVDTSTKTTRTTTTNSTIKTTTTTTTTTTKQGEPERSTTKTLNLDAKKGTTVTLEKVTIEASVKNATALHVQGVPSRAPHSRPPTNTQGKNGTASPQGKLPPVKRKASATGQGAAKVARVQVPKEDQPSAVPEKDGTRLASRPTSAATNGAEEEDKLDEMKALCPHDLLGRCNDTSCQYQHLPAIRAAPQAQSSPSICQEPLLSSRGNEPQTPTSTTSKQGKVVERAWAKQVKVTSGSAVPSERSSEEVKSQLLPDTHVSEQQHQTETVVENGTATTALEDSDSQATSQTAVPTTEQIGTPITSDTEMQASTPTDTHTTSQTAPPTTEQTGTPNTSITDSKMQGCTPTDSQATSQTSAPTTEELTATPNTTTTATEMQQAPTDTPSTTDTQPYTTQHQTDTDIKTTVEQTERHELQAGTSVGNSTEATITDTDAESQTPTAPTEPQETQTGTEMSVQGWQTDEAVSVEALNATVTEPQREPEASTAQTETPTCTREPETTESVTNKDAATPQTGTTSGTTERQTGVEDTEIDTETSGSVTRELSDSSTMIAESEDKVWLPSDVESLASTASSNDCLPVKHQPPKPSSRPAKRRASCRKSRESTEDAVPSQDLQSEGGTVNKHQKTQGTRKSLRVKAKASPKGTQPPKMSAKSTASGKGQKRKSSSPSKHPSSKKRHSTKP